MDSIIKILLDALPEIIAGIILALLSYLGYQFLKLFKRKKSKSEKIEKEIKLKLPELEFPSNLPPRTDFIGRQEEKNVIKRALNSRWPLILIDGIGGIGKTSLALEVAYESLHASKNQTKNNEIPLFDGFVWNSARNRDLEINDLLDTIARTLNWPGIAQQPLEEKNESVKRLFQTKKYLIIVDNFETITDELIQDFLLNLPEPSKALITSREQSLRQAWTVSLKGMKQDEALNLIHNEGNRLGIKSLKNAEMKTLIYLYEATGGAPLAIKWAIGQIKQKGQSIECVLEALHGAKGDIFKEVFDRSWSLLTENSKKILMVMPIFASSASKEAIEAGSNLHHFELDEGIGQLIQMWLLESTDEIEKDKKRYSVHPLTRAFAKSNLYNNKIFGEKAQINVIDWLLEFARKNGGYENWGGFARLENEIENILAMIHYCYEHKNWKTVMNFCDELWHYLGTKGYWNERIKLGKQAIAAADKLNDEIAIAEYGVHTVSWICIQQNRFDEAYQFVTRSLKIFEKLKDGIGIGMAKLRLGEISIKRKENQKAAMLLKEALELFDKFDAKNKSYKRYNPPANIAMTYTNLAILSFRKNDFKQTENYHQKAYEVARNANVQAWVSMALSNLGYIYFIQNKLKESQKLYEQALKINSPLGTLDIFAKTKERMGLLREKKGEFQSAIELYKEAEEIFQRLDIRKNLEHVRNQIKNLNEK